jgi:hypothetical protein
MSSESNGKGSWQWSSMPEGGGVFAIRRTSSGRSYYAGVANLRQRAYDHHRLLERGAHHNADLQRDWHADPTDFEFVVVEHVRYRPMLRLFKQCWIEREQTPYNQKNSVPRRRG